MVELLATLIVIYIAAEVGIMIFCVGVSLLFEYWDILMGFILVFGFGTLVVYFLGGRAALGLLIVFSVVGLCVTIYEKATSKSLE